MPEKNPENDPKQKILAILNSQYPETQASLTDHNGLTIILLGGNFDRSIYEMHQMSERYFREDETDFKGIKIVELGQQGLPFRNCLELTFPNKEKIYIIHETEFEILKQNGVSKKTDSLEKLLDTWPDETYEQEKKVLLGEYPSITPMLAGLKPVGYIRETRGDAWSKAKITFIRSLPTLEILSLQSDETYNDYIVYNPKSVARTLIANKELFVRCDLTQKLTPTEIVKQVFMRENAAKRSEAGTNIDRILGLLLGFDRTSVLKFPDQKATDVHFNIWKINYAIYEPDKNEDYKRLKENYELLLAKIEAWLRAGLNPKEIISKIATTYQVLQEIPE
ncbi:MAG: hypothetical protein UT36_C0009G0030 [Candidatus Peregrinibacteria bacterium GW2011_GWF2_39_17]|nr:MAG: hypothetical protein UT36_C0009G0030 [Candidatus Peregrinibacteria bacterium GW2011_GWF2_39_17]HCW32725.1 hypothetical protein [Candidatus Peregrinibacteria bacterium]